MRDLGAARFAQPASFSNFDGGKCENAEDFLPARANAASRRAALTNLKSSAPRNFRLTLLAGVREIRRNLSPDSRMTRGLARAINDGEGGRRRKGKEEETTC